MNKFLHLCAILILLVACNSYRSKAPVADGTYPYNPYVEAFTTGKISRFSPVYLILAEKIPVEKQQVSELGRLVRIKPEVAGEYSFEDERTILFKPTGGFERDQTYEVTADLAGWLPVQPEERHFTYTFSTWPLELRSQLESMDTDPNQPELFNFTFTLYSRDQEAPEVIESLIRLSEKAETSWQHSPDGKKHQITLRGVQSSGEGGRTLTLSVAPNKMGVKETVLEEVKIPGKGEFTLFDVKVVSEPEYYVELTFTRPLDRSQEKEGLVSFKPLTGTSSQTEGNKLRLYLSGTHTGIYTVAISKGLRDQNGQTLSSDISREILFKRDKPDFRFTGNGVIMPRSHELIVPFQAIHLRGVIARVIRIREQNIGQFLQVNALNGQQEIMRSGQLIARKTIFLDDDENLDLTEWNTFGIDLRSLIDPEPGAIYRVELGVSKDLSVYPCDDTEKQTKEEILADDPLRFEEEISRYDDYRQSYYYWYYWDDYYDSSGDPCEAYYYRKRIGKNILTTNLGLIAKRGETSEMTVLVHDLVTTQPVSQVDIRLYNYQHELLGTGKTGNDGQAVIGLGNRKPFYVVASSGKQRSYLRIDDGSALSLSSFDVSGETIQKGLKSFIYGERGIWRPGDTIHVGFMLNDREKSLPDHHPVIMELTDPLGQLYSRKTQSSGELGLYTFSFPTDEDVPTGAWHLKASVGGVQFEKRIRVESIKPNRLKIKLETPPQAIYGGRFTSKLHVEWMQGATARGLKYEMDGIFTSTTTTFNGYTGYVFDDIRKQFETTESRITTGKLDNTGNATIDTRIETGSSAPGMLLANLVTRVYEESGEFSTDADRILYSPYQRYVGIRSPQGKDRQLNTEQSYAYELATTDYLGKTVAGVDLDVKIYKVNWYWWWNASQNQLANYISDTYTAPFRQMQVTTDTHGKASFDLSVERGDWGTYLVTATDKAGGHSSALMNYYDWPDYGGRRDREGQGSAQQLTFKTDKEKYAPGEKIVISLPSSEGSRAIVSIENGTRILSLEEYSCQEGETEIRLEATEAMQPNAYVHIILLQPHGQTLNDLPVRLYGIAAFTVESPGSHLHPIVQTADEFKPESDYRLTVSEKDGREMAYTLAIVDEGLLDLTRFPTPDPWRAFNGREALGVITWDHYNHIIGTYGGRIEQLFSIGGDDALNKGPKAIVNRFRPVVEFAGPFRLKKGEKRTHTFRMPNYNGRVRVMVVAGDGKAYGNTEKSVMVRKPLMMLGTLPRVIGVGEEMSIPATVFATEAGIGNVQVSIHCSNNLEILGDPIRTLHFDRIDDKQANFRVRVKNNPGTGRITLTATGKGDKAVYETDIEIRSVTRPQTRVVPITLRQGENWQDNLQLPGSEGTNSLTLEVSNIPPVNLSSRLSYLIGYPHGCLEQITSKGFPQLYLSRFVPLTSQQETTISNAIKEVIRRLRSYQLSEGGFAYWPGAGDSNDWGTVYATHFLLEAEAKGYVVPAHMKQSAIQSLQRAARAWKPVPAEYYRYSQEMIQAYRLVILAMAGETELGAMNRLKENETLHAESRWLLAWAYALAGRTDVSQTLTQRVTLQPEEQDRAYDLTFGSQVRDKAITLLTLSRLNRAQEAAELSREISEALSSEEWMSTQTTAWSLMALSDYIERYPVAGSLDFNYRVANHQPQPVKSQKNIWSEKLTEQGAVTQSLSIENQSDGTIFVRAILEGTPEQGTEKAYANQVALSVRYFDMSGKPLQIEQIEQGTNFIARVDIRNGTPRPMNNLVLTQIFPAGWEILNTRYLTEEASAQENYISYQDIRDDRVYSYIDLLGSGRAASVTIRLIAAYPGQFYLPPVYCEAMYDHQIRANTEGKQVTIK